MAGNFALVFSKTSETQGNQNLDSLSSDIKMAINKWKKDFSYGDVAKDMFPGLLGKFIKEVETQRKDRLQNKSKEAEVMKRTSTANESSSEYSKQMMGELVSLNDVVFGISQEIVKIRLLLTESAIEKMQSRENAIEMSRKRVQNLSSQNLMLGPGASARNSIVSSAIESVVPNAISSGVGGALGGAAAGLLTRKGIGKVLAKSAKVGGVIGLAIDPAMQLYEDRKNIKETFQKDKEEDGLFRASARLKGEVLESITVGLLSTSQSLASVVAKSMGFDEAANSIEKELRPLISAWMDLGTAVTTLDGKKLKEASAYFTEIGTGFLGMVGIKPREETLNTNTDAAREDVKSRGMSQEQYTKQKENIKKMLKRQYPQKSDKELNDIAEERVKLFSMSMTDAPDTSLPTANAMVSDNAMNRAVSTRQSMNPTITVTAPTVTSVDARTSNNAFLQPVERNQDRAMNDIRGSMSYSMGM
jgi:hypothetical protein